MNKLFFFSFFFLVIMMPFNLAIGLNITIHEDGGKITSFYDEYYIARAKGTLIITNPSDADFFNIVLPLYMSTYSLRSINNTPLNFIDESGIYVLELAANSSISFNYEIGGISSEDFTKDGMGMLERALSEYDLRIYSNVMGSLFKAPIEDPLISGNSDTRLVSVHLRNPTGYDFNVDALKVIKTTSLDPSAQINSWDFTSDVSSLSPHQVKEFDIMDSDAHEGEIYWLQTDIYLDDINIYAFNNISHLTQDDLFIPISNGTNITYNDSLDETFEKRVFIRKSLSSALALPGQSINVSVVVNNFGTTSIAGSLDDSFPSGFTLKEVYTLDSSIENNNLLWDIEIPPRSAKRYEYEVTFEDRDSVGVDYFDPATITYGDNFVYSQSVPFVRRYVDEKKVYVQKSLNFRPDGDVEISIAVRNLGESALSNLILKEYLGPNDQFREITQPFRKKGVWFIDNILAGDVWETSYVTDKSNVLNSFPELFGVPHSGLFRNIILKNIVESKFKILRTNGVEFGGLTLLALVLLLYILPHSTLLSLKRRFIKDLKMTDRELDLLKKSSSLRTNFHPDASMKQSSSSKVFSSLEKSSVNSKEPLDEVHQRMAKVEETQHVLDNIKKRIEEEK